MFDESLPERKIVKITRRQTKGGGRQRRRGSGGRGCILEGDNDNYTCSDNGVLGDA